MIDFKIQENTEKKRFEAIIEGQAVFIEYIRAKGNVIYLTHTEVPSVLEGKGIGSALVRQVLDKVKEEGVSIAPLCPFVAAFIKRHLEYKPLVAAGYNV